MLNYDRIGAFEGINIIKTNASWGSSHVMMYWSYLWTLAILLFKKLMWLIIAILSPEIANMMP